MRMYRAKDKPGKHETHRGHREPGQGGRHRPVADRPHPALEPGDVHEPVHRDPRPVRRAARRQDARLQAGPLLVQREGRPLRGVPGRRHHPHRDAVPARRLRAVRGLPRQALQPRGAGDQVQGQEHRRRARHDGRRGAGVLPEHPAHPQQAADAARGRPGLHPAGPAGDHAVGRRGAARQAEQGAEPPRDGQDAVHPGRADDRPALRRRPEAARRCSSGWSTRATRSS